MKKTGAEFSSDRVYRYRLWREWDKQKGSLCFVMLNPSTADENVNDPTVERCERRAVQMGFGRLDVVNIFALRSTDPMRLYEHAEPVGPANDRHILDAAGDAKMLVLGWGGHGRLRGRGRQVIDMLRGYQPHVLKLTKNLQPGHPLYVGYDQKPVLFTNILLELAAGLKHA